jgi:hypothetical protein
VFLELDTVRLHLDKVEIHRCRVVEVAGFADLGLLPLYRELAGPEPLDPEKIFATAFFVETTFAEKVLRNVFATDLAKELAGQGLLGLPEEFAFADQELLVLERLVREMPDLREETVDRELLGPSLKDRLKGLVVKSVDLGFALWVAPVFLDPDLVSC